MSYRAFLNRLAGVLGAGVALAVLLYAGLGESWFRFYGWATVALATFFAVTYLLWERLPSAGQSRFWAIAFLVPGLMAAAAQIVFWVLFFRWGGVSPELGVAREMVRPWLEAGTPYLVAAYAILVASVVWRCKDPEAQSGR